jgi:hypothetical protein
VILSTAHKAKWREWESVHLAPDFLNSRLKVDDPYAEAKVQPWLSSNVLARPRMDQNLRRHARTALRSRCARGELPRRQFVLRFGSVLLGCLVLNE